MDDISRRHGRSLPHWSRPDGTYFLTFRTHDSIPEEVVRRHREEFEFDLRRLERELGQPPSREEARSVYTDRYRRIEKYLDKGHGECLLKDPRIAKIVVDAILFFDADRYDLHAWCLMPNHAHVILTLRGDRLPTEVMGSWKSFTAKAINRVLGRTGPFWQEEGFDHLIRGSHSFQRMCRYAWENPAGLPNWPWVGGAGDLPEVWRESNEG